MRKKIKDTTIEVAAVDPDQQIVNITLGYLEEAKQARQSRMSKNKRNFECYHLEQDYSHKLGGQSKEFVGKQAMAVEQITSFIQQGLVDSGEWFTIEKMPGVDNPPIRADEVKALLARDLDACEFVSVIADAVKLGLLQSLMIAKPHGVMKDRARFYTEQKQKADGKYEDVVKRETKPYWSPRIDLLRAEDFYPDPTGNKLYFIQETYMDFHDMVALSKGEKPIYDSAVIEGMGAGFSVGSDQEAKKSGETGQNAQYSYSRKRVKIHECWGTIVDSTGEVLHKEVTWTIADDRYLIRKPTDNPFWHGQFPFITAPFIRVPHAVWPKALMDGPTSANMALNELFNLMVDDGMMSVHGLKQIHTDWLEDESQIENGIYPGIMLKVNEKCPPGARAVEVVPTNGMSAETMNVYQMMNSEFSAMALTNDLRMGVMPNRAVKATEVVEASQSITGVMSGISKVIEVIFIEPTLYQMWSNRLQHMDESYRPEMESVLGKDRANEIMAMSKEQRFVECVDGFKFKVFGVSRVLSKQKDFRKITGLLQTIAADPILMEEFHKEYKISGLLGEIMRALDISLDRVKLDPEEAAQMEAEKQAALQAQQGAAPQGGPDMQSQIPQASAQESAESVESLIPRSDMSGLNGKAQGGIN